MGIVAREERTFVSFGRPAQDFRLIFFSEEYTLTHFFSSTGKVQQAQSQIYCFSVSHVG
jgi:hypothetical protein